MPREPPKEPRSTDCHAANEEPARSLLDAETRAFIDHVIDEAIDDLRDKTMRGLEGRARASYSTGQTPIGYRAVPENGPRVCR